MPRRRDGDDFTHIFTESLCRIPASQIEKIEFLTGPQATLRFGTDTPNGAILITTTRSDNSGNRLISRRVSRVSRGNGCSPLLTLLTLREAPFF